MADHRSGRAHGEYSRNHDSPAAPPIREPPPVGLRAETIATIDRFPIGGAGDLAAFMRQLVDDWQGWHGRRVWHALEHEMTVEAVHDGRAHAVLAVTLR